MHKNKKIDLPEDVKTRQAAVQIVTAVLDKKQPLDSAFDTIVAGYDRFDVRDIAFVREVVMRLLRRKGQIDDALQTVCDRPLNKITPQAVLMLLRVGAVQILFMDVKAHAAVDTMVTLAQNSNMVKQKGFINAALRNLDRKRESILKTQKGKEGRLNTPAWLYQSWCKDYGAETADRIAGTHVMPAPVDLTLRDKNRQAEIAADLDAQVLPNGNLRMQKSGKLSEKPGFKDGLWWVQNISAALPVDLVRNIPLQAAAADICAAPGGKTLQLCARGASVTAVDISKNRLKRLHENLERCGFTATVLTADAKKWGPDKAFDVILVDAPCSATGTIRHQPDVMHSKSENDIDKLVTTQRDVLENAARFLKPGGTLVFCTCSLQKREGEEVVSNFLNKNNEFSIDAIKDDEVPWAPEMITPEGWLRILPFHLQEYGGMDGFFIARLIRA